MKQNLLCHGAWLVLFLLPGILAPAQVTILPTSVFLTDQWGLGSVDISNNTGQKQEVSIDFQFAWLGNDEDGGLMMINQEDEIADRYSVDEQIRAFPRSFLLPPGGSQTIRVQVRPLREKPDGVYWTRAVITSSPAASDIDHVSLSENIGTRIQYVFKQNIPVFYKKGEVNTGLQILEVKTEMKTDRIVVYVRLRPTGNAPYNGRVQTALRNSSGQVILNRQTTAVIYFESLRRLELPLSEVPLDQGIYALELLYETKRNDIPASELVQAVPVTYTVLIKIG
ncbi:MAG: hypothetical protein PHV35_10780 [Mariniphaga sp.]|nr:hypothetical protein [Mariniphaga sp.]